MADYKYRAKWISNPDGTQVSYFRVEAIDQKRNMFRPAFEAEWKSDGTPFDAYQLLEDNEMCEKCAHGDIPGPVYLSFIQEMENLKQAITCIIKQQVYPDA